MTDRADWRGFDRHHSAETIGAKAASLVGMAALGLPVPFGFVLPIELCAQSSAGDPHAEHQLVDGLKEGIAFLENVTGKRFGDRRRPLLVSVRSGAARSLPGMLDTVLNIGCTSNAVRGPRAHDRKSALCLGLPPPISRRIFADRSRNRSGALTARLAANGRRRECRQRSGSRQRGTRTSRRRLSSLVDDRGAAYPMIRSNSS